jgi:hypothetical protein
VKTQRAQFLVAELRWLRDIDDFAFWAPALKLAAQPIAEQGDASS